MKKIKWMKILIGICMSMIVPALAGCANNATHEKNENPHPPEILE